MWLSDINILFDVIFSLFIIQADMKENSQTAAKQSFGSVDLLEPFEHEVDRGDEGCEEEAAAAAS